MISQEIGMYPNTGGNTVQGLWRPVSNGNTVGKAGLLGKVVALSAAVAATSVGTSTLVPTDGDTVTIGGIVYRFKATIAQINDVFINTTDTACLLNLLRAITGTGTVGTDYFTGTLPNPLVTATASTATTISLAARENGVVGNGMATASSRPANFSFTAFAGGVDGTTLQPGGQAGFAIVTAASDYPTDILVDDCSGPGDTDNTGKTVGVAPLDALIQFRLPVVLGGGNPGDLLILAPSPNLGSVQPLTGSLTGTYNRVFQALESFQPGQAVLARRYYGTQT